MAFMVLTIVLALFAQGMRFAQTAENYAVERSRDSDSAMKEMLKAMILLKSHVYKVWILADYMMKQHLVVLLLILKMQMNYFLDL